MSQAVSVIVPNYNHAPYLKQRIDSILAQTWANFELILLDDHSTDNSKDIMETYRQHPKLKQIVYNEHNSGNTFVQWKKGIALASNELIWIAESDDWCEPTFLEELVPVFMKEESMVLAQCQLQCVRDNRIVWRSTAEKIGEVVAGKEYNINSMLGVNNVPNASAVLFRKSCFEKVPTDYLNMKYCGDWFIWSEMIRMGNIFISGKYLNYFRKHGADVSGKSTVAGLDFLEGIRIFEKITATDKPNNSSIKKGLEKVLARYQLLKDLMPDTATRVEVEECIVLMFEKNGMASPFIKPGLLKKIARRIYP